jgi:hypothetical protein
MLRVLRTILVAGVLAGCSSVFDKVPSELGGLPAGAPARPDAPHVYPAVHDMPPPRAEPTMSVEQQQKVEDDLRATRDRQEQAQDKPAPAPKAKRKPAPPAN